MEARTVLVGREAEQKELAAVIEAAAAGTPSALIISGEAGIGKTRLVTDVTTALRGRGVRALWGRCLRFGTADTSYQPVGQLLTQWHRQSGEAERLQVLHGLPVGKLATIAPVLGAPSDDEAGDLMPVLATVLERIAEVGPVVIVIDDLQWSDTTSLDLLAFLVAGFGPGQRLALIGTYRNTDLHEGHRLHGWLADLRRLPSVSELRVERLGLLETEQLVAALSGEEGVVARAAAVFERSEGNPYLTELLALAPAGDDDAGAGGLRAALLASWHRLGGSARRVAQLLAVGGRPVQQSILEELAVVRGESPHVVRGSVAEIIAAGVATVDAAGQVWFRHPLISEVLVSTISSVELQEIHGEYARLWEGANGGSAAARAAHLALHHDGAQHHDDAFVWSLQAAAAAADLLAWSEEFEHLQRACRLWPKVDLRGRGTDSDQEHLLARASESAIRAGDYHVALHLREQALCLVDRQERPLDAARHHFRIEVLRAFCGSDDFVVAPEMLTLTERVPDSPERAIALSLLARSEFWSGQSLRALRDVDEAVRIARRSGSDEALAWAVGVRSQAHHQTPEGIEDAEQALVHARATGDRVLMSFTAMWRANWLQEAGLKATAAERTLEVYSELVETGSFYEAVQLLAGVCERLVEIGQWSLARDLLRQGLSHRLVSSSGSGLRLVAADLAARTGDLDAAEQHVVRARELAPQRHLIGGYLVSAETRVAMAKGQQAEALTLMAEAMPETRTFDHEAADELLVWAARAAADLAVKPGEHANAVEWLERIDRLREDTPARFAPRAPDDRIHPAWRALYAAEVSRCRDGGARRPDVWQGAVDACLSAGLPWEQALCSYRLAQSLLVTKGSRAQAASALRAAARVAAELGAAPILADVESLARQGHLSLTEPASAGADGQVEPVLAGLTRREDEVLRHLVAGRTYAEIARALFISEKTVSVHISNLLRKTGTSSRIEVADLARRVKPG